MHVQIKIKVTSILNKFDALTTKLYINVIDDSNKKLATEAITNFNRFVFVLMFIAIFHVWTRIVILDQEYDISDISESLAQDKKTGDLLKLEVMTLKSPDRINKIAKEQLDMALPDDNQILFINNHSNDSQMCQQCHNN